VPVNDVAAHLIAGDISAGQAATAALSFKDCILKVVVDNLKDILIHRLVAQTIRWIQGGGKPQFITNWKGFLEDTVTLSADQSISDLYPGLCQSFGPLIRIAVLPTNLRDLPPACTLDRVIANVRAFADSFENGGWVAYGAALQPSNNFFGSLIQANEFIMRRAAAAREAAQNDAMASNGYSSSRTCVKWENASPGPCPPGEVCNDAPKCIEWTNTTPGAVLAGIVNSSFAAPILRIVNAEDLVTLLNALINSGLNKLVTLSRDTVSGEFASGNVSKGILGIEPYNPDLPPAGEGGDTGGGIEGGTCATENCSAGCYCKGHDGITADNFCFLGDVVAAQDAVQADYDSNKPGTGLGGTGVVVDPDVYKAAVAAKLTAKGLSVNVGEEICITGSCSKPVCSAGSDASCPRPRAAGTCIDTTSRKECTKIESSAGAVRKWIPNGICPAS